MTSTVAKSEYKVSNVTFGSNCISVNLDTTKSKFTEKANYTLTINNIPTPDEVHTAPGSFVLSIGKLKTGSLAMSSS